MIKEKLLILEYETKINNCIDNSKLKALKSLKTALIQIDTNSEIIPHCDYNRLLKLFESLLDRQVNQCERSIIEHLIES